MKNSYLILLLIMVSCKLPVPSFEPEKKIIKEIKGKSIILEWYTYSGNLSQSFPSYITVLSKSKSDTICISDNISDLKIKEDKIVIGFYGIPKLYTEEVNVPSSVIDYKIIVDTTYVLK